MNTQCTRWSTTDSIIACGLGMLLATLGGCTNLEKEAMEAEKAPTQKLAGPVASATAKQPGLALAMAGDDTKALGRVVGSAKDKQARAVEALKSSSPEEPSAKVSGPDSAGSPNCEDETSGLALVKLTFAGALEGREPADDETSFSADGGRVFAHLRLASLDEGRKVKVVFKRYDREYYTAELDVGKSPRWRTWASVAATPDNAGSWTVEVQDEHGQSLASRKFEIEAGGPIKATRELSEQALPSGDDT